MTTYTEYNFQYVGSASTEIKVRFCNHKSALKTSTKTCKFAIRFNSTPHALSDFQFIFIEKILQQADIESNSKLNTREAYWTVQIRTLRHYGLNKRLELRLTLSGRGGAGEGGSARANFNLQEIPYYLSNTYEILPLSLKLIGEGDFVKKIVKGITCCHGNPICDAMFGQILTFLIFFS